MNFPLFFGSVKILLGHTKRYVKKFKKNTWKFYLKTIGKNMLQGTLLTTTQINQKTVQRGGIVAIFTNHDDVHYDVELTINTIKFVCSYRLGLGEIESFEIIASKGMSVITKKLIVLLKETVLHLSYRM
ncbi:MAG: hypothetical protein CR971_00885 [candidate division SR1 bacterium]|nr:MAG: hypothetical protein CR971_00885 [candidate division SR1 bacterium]